MTLEDIQQHYLYTDTDLYSVALERQCEHSENTLYVPPLLSPYYTRALTLLLWTFRGSPDTSMLAEASCDMGDEFCGIPLTGHLPDQFTSFAGKTSTPGHNQLSTLLSTLNKITTSFTLTTIDPTCSYYIPPELQTLSFTLNKRDRRLHISALYSDPHPNLLPLWLLFTELFSFYIRLACRIDYPLTLTHNITHLWNPLSNDCYEEWVSDAPLEIEFSLPPDPLTPDFHHFTRTVLP